MFNVIDTISVFKYRWRFRRGPVGHWASRAGGGGFDMVHWFAIQFASDGTGTLSHSWIPGDLDDIPAGNIAFVWRAIGNRRIEIRLNSDEPWNAISYDFFVRRNEYEIAEVCLEQTGQTGFWLSPYPMAYVAHPVEERVNSPLTSGSS
jgi:hypothetical protein